LATAGFLAPGIGTVRLLKVETIEDKEHSAANLDDGMIAYKEISLRRVRSDPEQDYDESRS
jgi:hypothetical protein